MAWVKLNAEIGVTQTILQQEGVNGRGWLYRKTAGDNLCSSLGGFETCSTGPLSVGEWYHTTLTFDGVTLRLYINGLPDGFAGRTMESETGFIRVGRHKLPDTSNEEWDGIIDEVRIYSRALSAEEIRERYNDLR